MSALLFLAVAGALLYADKLRAFLEANRDKLRGLSWKHAAAVACVVAALLLWHHESQPIDDGRPTPAPGAVGELDLTGLFTGPTAAEDAAALAALCDELGNYVQDDGDLAKPRLTTGWQIADLRAAARDIRLKGETFGSRQPAVRDAVKTYLDRPEVLGKNGGPISPKDRARWVAAFKDIARAAEAAIK